MKIIRVLLKMLGILMLIAPLAGMFVVMGRLIGFDASGCLILCGIAGMSWILLGWYLAFIEITPKRSAEDYVDYEVARMKDMLEEKCENLDKIIKDSNASLFGKVNCNTKKLEEIERTINAPATKKSVNETKSKKAEKKAVKKVEKKAVKEKKAEKKVKKTRLEEVAEWRVKHPGGTKAECIKSLGIPKSSVYKCWM